MIRQILLADLIWFLATIPVMVAVQVFVARRRARLARGSPIAESLCRHCARCHDVYRPGSGGPCVASGYCDACEGVVHAAAVRSTPKVN